MAIEVFNRQEKKFLLSEEKYLQLIDRIQDHMELDAYNREHEFYGISNIYYDTEDDRLIRASIEKPVYKEKLRMRSYGTPTQNDKVYIEIKKKYKGNVNKRRTGMELGNAAAYLDNNILPDLRNPMINRQVFKEIDYFKKFYQTIPKVYLAYQRKAFFEKNNGDFRVTFDKDIITRRYDLDLSLGCYGERLLPRNTFLMEIKINRAVPLWFTKILSDLQVYPTSFSKYGTEYKKYLIEQNNNVTKGKNLCLNQYLLLQQLKMPSRLVLQ